MNRFFHLVGIIGFASLLVACRKDNPQVTLADYHYDYFPIHLGSYWTYDVVEISHDQNVTFHTIPFPTN